MTGPGEGYSVSDPELLESAAHRMMTELPGMQQATKDLMALRPNVTESQGAVDAAIDTYVRAIACLATATQERMEQLKTVGLNYQELEHQAQQHFGHGNR